MAPSVGKQASARNVVKQSSMTACSQTDTAGAVRTFYEKHPYPSPVDDLESYRNRWPDTHRKRAAFHLLWPNKNLREDYSILVAGCGTAQAARYAMRWPDSRVVGIDFSAAAVRHTIELKRRYRLDNLDVRQLPLEMVADLGMRFDHIISTGVIHHLSDPMAGLVALRNVLEPDGAMHLMVYAPYGRAGIYMLQDFFRRLLGPGAGFRDVVTALECLPATHPLISLLSKVPDFKTKEGLADALLNPHDQAYSVPQLFLLLRASGLVFGRWLRQAAYSFQVGIMSRLPDAIRGTQLSNEDEYAASELFRGDMMRHSAIAYRDDRPCVPKVDFSGNSWLGYVPIPVPDSVCLQERLPAGIAAVLINRAHTFTDIVLPLRSREKQLFDQVNGERAIGEIVSNIDRREDIRTFFERLWWHDQIVFDTTCT